MIVVLIALLLVAVVLIGLILVREWRAQSADYPSEFGDGE